MPLTPSLRHCSNKYKLAREGEKGKEKDEDIEKGKDFFLYIIKITFSNKSKKVRNYTKKIIYIYLVFVISYFVASAPKWTGLFIASNYSKITCDHLYSISSVNAYIN